MRLGLPAAFAALFLLATGLVAPAVAEAGPGMVVGAVEDNVRASSLVEAETRMELLRVSGFRAVRITSYWNPGRSEPTEHELGILENAAAPPSGTASACT